MQLELNFESNNSSSTIKKVQEQPKVNNSKIIAKLRKGAESLLNQADALNTEVQGNWTRRRQGFADSAREKKDRFIKDATVLNRLADLWEVDQCPDILKNIKTKSDFSAYYPKDLDGNENEYYVADYPNRRKKAIKMGLTCPEDNDVFKEAIYQLSIIKLSPEEEKKIELDKALAKIRAANIPGFFPTPDELIDKMIDLAELEPHHSIFEPSAGIGSICDKLREHGHTGIINACEIMVSLYDILRLKSYVCANEDVLETTKLSGEKWDRVIMNPPFEKKQDIIHVMHCYNVFLKDGGRLVSIMSAGVKHNSDKKSVEFREFVESKGGWFEDNGQAFKGSFNNTAVTTVTLVIDK